MITDRTSYYQNKPCSHSMLKGFILALSIHGILFFAGGRYFVKPAQYSVQSDTGSIDVDLMTAVSQSDTESVQSIPTAMEKPQEFIKTVPQEKQEASAQPSVASTQSFTPATEKQEEPVKTLQKSETDAVSPNTHTIEKQQEQETVKITSQGEQMAVPQPGMNTVNTLVSPGEKQKEAVKTMPRSSQGTIRTKSKPGYFQNQPPEYPHLAKQMRQEGLVILRVEIDEKGMPVQVKIEQSSGYQLLDRAALKAVRQWRFQPELRGDLPVKSRAAIPVRFRLDE
ncbi:MAG: energy transducer TonB [Candidatus Brocadia sp.]|nr:energy transducer TonB [Candidatus Brocadia sp.]